ncbi:YadA C-terminal domain-containing protein [Haemophilus haemolyticus]|uniref:YadA C-terminal domain-containing protein n=2 Tax=Haemophilus haemolyticus TaxID=726 RepID=UPI00195769B4|nr:YadA-like family protein [Haemophilus haemolyticus]
MGTIMIRHTTYDIRHTTYDIRHTTISKLILTAAATGIGISAVPYAQADGSGATSVRKLMIENPIDDDNNKQEVVDTYDPENVITYGRITIGYDGGGTLITNISRGGIGPGSTDAVTGEQLYQLYNHVPEKIEEKLEEFRKNLKDEFSESESDVKIKYSDKTSKLTLTLSEDLKEKINNISNSGGKGEKEVHERISSIEQKVGKLDKSMNGGIAKAGAVALLPQPTYAGHSMVSASTAHYNGEQALAIGYSRLSDNGKVILKAGTSFNFSGNNTKKPLFGAAVGYQW